MKAKDVAIEYFNLVRNENGFEESIDTGTKEDMERLRLELEMKEKEEEKEQAWEKISYYLVAKREWNIEHCPLMPVDYS